MPILAGVIPVAGFAQTKRICELCDATDPARRWRRPSRPPEGTTEREFELGVAYASQQCAELLIAGAPGIHFYALNRAPATRAVLGALRAARPWERVGGGRGRPGQRRLTKLTDRRWRIAGKKSGSACARPGWSARRSRRAASGAADDRLRGRRRWSGLVVVAGIVVLIASSGGSSGGGDAHINQSSGSTNGVQPDDRSGPKPPPVKVANLKQAAKQAGCDAAPAPARKRGTSTSRRAPRRPHYKTNPPTSGNHVEPPYQQADGAYSEMPEEIDFVHSLEHGRLEIQYSPKLSESGPAEALKGLYDTMYGATLLFPNEKMPYQVAATTWRNLLGCPKYKGAITLDAIRDFGKATWGVYGSEPISAFPFTGPTPANPEGSPGARGRPGRSRRCDSCPRERRA